MLLLFLVQHRLFLLPQSYVVAVAHALLLALVSRAVVFTAQQTCLECCRGSCNILFLLLLLLLHLRLLHNTGAKVIVVWDCDADMTRGIAIYGRRSGGDVNGHMSDGARGHSLKRSLNEKMDNSSLGFDDNENRREDWALSFCHGLSVCDIQYSSRYWV